MKEISMGGVKVEMYDGIDELPMSRFHKYNKMLLVDAGIGSDMADFDRHITKAAQYIGKGDRENAVKELENLRQLVNAVQQGLSPRHMAFAALVKSIGGEPCGDISDDGIRRTAERLATLTAGETATALGAAKKKIDTELRLYFPRLFDDAASKEYHSVLKRRTAEVLKAARGEDGAAANAERLATELLLFFDPVTFSGSGSMEIRHDKQFEEMCLLLSRELHIDPKGMTVMEYYCAFEKLQEEARKARRRAAGMKK